MAFPKLVKPNESPEPAPLESRSDAELMTLTQAGSRAALAQLVERHALRLSRMCARFTGDEQRGRELAQDAWVKVWQNRDAYRGGSFVPWLVTIARNHCRNHLRHLKLAERHEDAKDLLGPEPAPEQIDRLLVLERQRRVQHALAELPSAMREALLLRYAEELRYDEMATVVGAGESTLRSRVHHGLQLMKKKLEKDA